MFLKSSEYNSKTILLNCARNAIRYIVRAFNIKSIYVPFYTCPVVWQTLKSENCKISFYHINSDFFPNQEFPEDAYIIYTNYSGICSENIKKLSKIYKNIIIDNAQAFYMKKYGIAAFNSVRKFIPAPDGAVLFCDKSLDVNFEREIASNNYDNSDFNSNIVLFDSKNIKLMSDITLNILNNTDLNQVRNKRLNNFNFLHSSLNEINGINISITADDVPMFYPFYTENTEIEKLLLSNDIDVEKFWNTHPSSTQEGLFQRNLLYLPVHQYQTTENLQKIIKIIQTNK